MLKLKIVEILLPILVDAMTGLTSFLHWLSHIIGRTATLTAILVAVHLMKKFT